MTRPKLQSLIARGWDQCTAEIRAAIANDDTRRAVRFVARRARWMGVDSDRIRHDRGEFRSKQPTALIPRTEIAAALARSQEAAHAFV